MKLFMPSDCVLCSSSSDQWLVVVTTKCQLKKLWAAPLLISIEEEDRFFSIDGNRNLTISAPIETFNFYLLSNITSEISTCILLLLSVLRDSANTIDWNDLLLSQSGPWWFQCLCSKIELLYLVFYLRHSFIHSSGSGPRVNHQSANNLSTRYIRLS